MLVCEKVETFSYSGPAIFVYENLGTSTVKSALLILIPKYLSLCVEAVRGHTNQGGSGAGMMTCSTWRTLWTRPTMAGSKVPPTAFSNKIFASTLSVGSLMYGLL
jgi:hypothetical protein